jgi:soluble lytic murein transglycosylase-like protein
MFKKRLKGHIMVEYKWMVLLKLLTLCMFIAAVYAFVSVETGIPAPEKMVQPRETIVVSEAEKTEDAKPAIMKWMKDRSIAPEHVLSKIYEEALRHTYPNLILAICAVESNFNPGVESEKGAVGLMGVLPSVWMEELKKQGILRDREDLYLISNNIASGMYVLEKYLLKSKNLEDALYAYAGGDRSYADKVLRTLGEIHLTGMPHVSEIKVRDSNKTG